MLLLNEVTVSAERGNSVNSDARKQ